MTKEQEITQKLINGELSGIITDGDYAYIPLRMTGTGLAERLDDNQKARIVDRRLEDFSTPDLMQQYANIPIVLTHPKDNEGNCVRAGIVNGGAFVGNTIASYLKGNEVWVIGRIHDADIVDLIMGNAKNGTDLSTSPHITSEEIEGENGIFVEKPLKVNSLAIVSKGFWDKKSTSPAIEGDNLTFIKEQSVADKEKADTMEQDVTSEQPLADKPVGDKADEATLEGKVADLEKHEAKEAESFEKLAEEHKNLDKGDSVEKEKIDAEVDKRELIREAMAVAGKSPEDFEGGKEEKVREEAKLAEELAYNNSEADKHDEEKEEKSDKCDEEIIVDDYFNDEDKEREEVLKKIIENADEGVKVPAIGNTRFKASALIKRFAKANSELVPDKFKGMVEKIDSSTSELNNELLNGMFENIKAKQEEARANAMSKQGSGLFSRFTDI